MSLTYLKLLFVLLEAITQIRSVIICAFASDTKLSRRCRAQHTIMFNACKQYIIGQYIIGIVKCKRYGLTPTSLTTNTARWCVWVSGLIFSFELLFKIRAIVHTCVCLSL